MSFARLDIAPRFRRSAQLDHDLWARDALQGYVVSQLARDVATRLAQEVAAEEGGRAFSIVGPYGSGKSSFLTFMLRLWRYDPDALERLVRDAHDVAPLVRSALDSLGGTLLPAVVTGERAPLAPAILQAVARAADRLWSGRGKAPDAVRIRLPDLLSRFAAGAPVSDHDVVDVVIEVAEKACRAPGATTDAFAQTGLVLVIDEMGKFSEWAALHPERSDLYLLQLLAERAARLSGTRLVLVTVLHQELAAYAENLPRAVREEWSKVAGRFETIPYLESPRHLTSLIAGALVVPPESRGTAAFAAATQATEALSRLVATSLADAPLVACFPLHPLAALCLGPLFRRRMAQNERSLFAFLASHEPFGFQDWLSRADLSRPKSGLYFVDQLFDYVLANVGVRGASEPGERVWAVADSALARLPSDATDLDARLIKAIALLTLLGPSLGLRPDAETLALATLAPIDACSPALERLGTASIVVFRQYKAAYQLWDGSDLDVSALIARNRLKVESRGGLADALNALVPQEPIVATRLGYESGTLRVMATRFVSDVGAGSPVTTADGEVLRVIPDRPEALDEIRRIITAGELAPSDRPIVYALPASSSPVYEAIYEYFAIVESIATTAELESDPVARRELEERRSAALDTLTATLGPQFNDHWFHRGLQIAVEGRPSRTASHLLRNAYSAAPVIRNELVNRSELSSAAAAARRELMERMLTHAAQLRLGIEGYPPELSLYRSTLESSGLHRPIDPAMPTASWHLTSPPPDSAMAATWNRIGELVRRSGTRRARFDALSSALEAPPFGIRPGVTPILIMAWLTVHAEEVFWYEQNTFVTTVTPDLIHRLLRRPDDFEVQFATPTGDLGVLVEAMRRIGVQGLAIDRRDTPLRVVRGIVKVISGLSPYSSSTQRVSVAARRLRAAVKGARDPLKLLLESIPEAIDGQPERSAGPLTPARATEIAIGLSKALRELTTAEATLLDEMEAVLARLLGGRGAGLAFREEVAIRARSLLRAGIELPPMTRRFVDLTAPLGDAPGDPEVREIWLSGIGTAVLGKAATHWTDADVDRYRLAAVEPCRSFVGAEQLALELGAAGDSPLRLVRVSMLDNQGNRSVGVGVLRPEEATLVGQFEADIVALARQRGISTPGLVYAVLSGMMSQFDGTPVQESTPDGPSRNEP